MRLDFCVACGERDPASLEHHHLVPRAVGGSDDNANLITLCHLCHGKAHGYQRQNVRALTASALAAAKARGVKLGGPKLADARIGAVETLKAGADARAANVLPVVRDIQAAGITSLNAIASTLNARGVPTARGGMWTHQGVKNLLARASA
jgi:hypothetical protein